MSGIPLDLVHDRPEGEEHRFAQDLFITGRSMIEQHCINSHTWTSAQESTVG